jgi:hypothetical protein
MPSIMDNLSLVDGHSSTVIHKLLVLLFGFRHNDKS